MVDPAWVNGPRLCMSGDLDVSPMAAAGESDAAAALYRADTLKLHGGHCFMLAPTAQDDSARQLLAWLAHHRLTN